MPYSDIYSFIFPLNLATWIFFLATLILASIFYWLAQKRAEFFSRGSNVTLLFYPLSLALEESSGLTLKENSNAFRIATCFSALSLFVLSLGYSGALVSFFAVDVYPKGYLVHQSCKSYSTYCTFFQGLKLWRKLPNIWKRMTCA